MTLVFTYKLVLVGIGALTNDCFIGYYHGCNVRKRDVCVRQGSG